MENKYYKVSHEGNSFITGYFYNPITKEGKRIVLRDYDYEDCNRDNDELYYMPINEEVRTIWLHDNGIIQTGDTVKVVKGRKVPIGTIAKVVSLTKYKDRYGRFQCIYANLDNGQRTNVYNCELLNKWGNNTYNTIYKKCKK